MKKSIVTIVGSTGVALALALGSVSSASAAPGHASTPAAVQAQISPVTAVSSNIQLTWNKTVAFAACITSVGVPIGVAWAIATNPAAIAWVLGRGQLPASVGGTVSKYLWYVKATCGYALFNIVYR